MIRIDIKVKRFGFVFFALPLLLLYAPVVSTAEDLPTGPDASTYTYNEGTGMWENDHYAWDPVTHKTYPKDERVYSYNTATGMWDTTEWAYNPDSGKYEPNIQSTSQPPPGNSANDPAATQDAAQTERTATPSSSTVNNERDAESLNEASASNSTFSGFFDASISNNLTSSARSGNATVTHNTSAGSATTGNATAISTIFNLLQATAPVGDLKNVATFATNIDGSVFGDLHVDPEKLTAMRPVVDSSIGSNLRVNNVTNGTINNKIIVGATSGNANVSGNTAAGDATSGNANAMVNLVNMLNSSVAAGQSFLGLININGDFNGDILLPADSLGTLLATNSTAAQTDLSVKNNNDQNINNTITLHANSGNALVSDNTQAGSATTGDTTTKLRLLNLTGHEVVGSDSLLVFVNVLGQWMGAILDAPAGTTAAAIGGGVTQNSVANGEVDVLNTSTSLINNDVTIDAQSGDASVNHNTRAGNATSGNASASANIANITNSSLSLSDWFGILFINVFGSWNGSFGIDTSAGNPLATQANPSGDQSSRPGAHGRRHKVFDFVPRPSAGAGAIIQVPEAIEEANIRETNDANKKDETRVLGVANTNDDGPKSPLSSSHQNVNTAIVAVIAGAVLLGIERILAYRDHQRLRQKRV